MADPVEEWRPGSFTKNFSWGSEKGLQNLHEIIRIGFDNSLVDVPRDVFRERVARANLPDYIPINFFLFNRLKATGSFLIVDELVFQAISFEHSERFDRLGLFAFILSMVGSWRGAKPYQERPAMWAYHYVADRIGGEFNWNASQVSADDIEKFVFNDPRYHAQGARKLATNLNYMLRVGGIQNYASRRVERWWVDALFLALDRIIETRHAQGSEIKPEKFESYLVASGFNSIAGRRSVEKDLCIKHIVKLYEACGERGRFDEEAVRELTAVKLPDLENWLANDPRPVAAIHLSNPRIVKTIPRACAMLAKAIGFLTFDVDDLAELAVDDLVRQNLETALRDLKEQGISPSMSAENLMKLMRGE
ncbi:MAG TPA: hypothetical protein VGC77_07680 [Rhodopseudomonas sp.]|uniref:hypothetical protein n=1 Tax=Rhodopseudomonas sp. TaxID=1078 RepID=UPI002ED9B39D